MTGHIAGNQCRGCYRMYTNNHLCPARDWQCQDCDQFGHLDGLCELFSGEAISFTFPHGQMAYPQEPVELEEFCAPMDREPSCETAYDTLQEIEQENHTNTGVCNTIKRNAEHSEPCGEFPGQKRQRFTSPFKEELDIFQDRDEALGTESQVLWKQQRNSEKNTNASVLIKKESETCNAMNTSNSMWIKNDDETSKADSYKKSSTKTIDELMAELEQTKAETMKLKSQRHRLFNYSQYLETFTKKLATRVYYLKNQHKYTMKLAYSDLDTASLPFRFRGRCGRCGSSKRHNDQFDCLANGYECQLCFEYNHFIEMCPRRKPAEYKLRPLRKMKKRIADIRADIAASK